MSKTMYQVEVCESVDGDVMIKQVIAFGAPQTIFLSPVQIEALIGWLREAAAEADGKS